MPVKEPVELGGPLSGVRRAAALLVALGAEVSSAILQKMTPEEIEKLTSEILLINRLEPHDRDQVLGECRKEIANRGSQGGAEYARALLAEVVGESQAVEIIGRHETASGNTLRWLRTVPSRQLLQTLGRERAQVVALILGHLPAEQAAEVMAGLPEELQGEVSLRLSVMQPTDPEVIQSVADILVHRLASGDSAVLTEVGGSKYLVDILNNVDRATERRILEYLTEADVGLANEIKESMFVFEDILSLDDRSIQVILRDVPQEDLRLALKGATDETKDTFFRNMSQRAAETLQEDLEATGPVKLRDVETAQGRIANVARQLDEAGEISLRDDGEEMVS